MSVPEGEQSEQRTPMARVAVASLLGAVLEWYDFLLFNTAAALVFAQIFFPSFSPIAGTLASFGAFAAGFLARPLGGVVFGHFGDRVGRKSMLIITMLFMGGSTFLVGLLPSYAAIGIWAPILLTTLRILQGIALGGEFGGAALMAVEHAPRARRGFWGSMPMLGPFVGTILGTGLLLGANTLLAQDQFLAWGWRIPFLFSAVLLAVGLYVRLRVFETPAFARMKEAGADASIPLVELVRTFPKNILLVFGARLVETTGSQLYATFALAYMVSQLGIARSIPLAVGLITSAIAIPLIPSLGSLSDRIGRRPSYLAGATLTGLMAFPFFWLVNTREPALIFVASMLGVISIILMSSVQATFFSELFGTRVRYSGISLSYQMSAVASGLVPGIATSLLAVAGGAYWPVATMMIGVALVGLACTYLLSETYRGDVSEGEEKVHSQQTVASESGVTR